MGEVLNILIVDDEEGIRLGLSELFKNSMAVDISLACDGKEGLGLTQERKYDLLIVDYKMPKLNGRDMIKQVTSTGDNPNAQTPIILFSAYLPEVGPDDELEELNNFISLEKPINPERILEYLQVILNKKKQQK